MKKGDIVYKITEHQTGWNKHNIYNYKYSTQRFIVDKIGIKYFYSEGLKFEKKQFQEKQKAFLVGSEHFVREKFYVYDIQLVKEELKELILKDISKDLQHNSKKLSKIKKTNTIKGFFNER